jgi:hypothetical protein
VASWLVAYHSVIGGDRAVCYLDVGVDTRVDPNSVTYGAAVTRGEQKGETDP